MISATCALCLENKELVSSHLIPRAVYNYCRTKDSEPIVMTAKFAMPTSRQLQHQLLCRACEGILNKGGENWLVSLLATIDKRFPLLDIIERVQPDAVDGDLRTYAASRNPEIEINKLIHFAMGVFWKASIHSWKGDNKTPQIELGPYGEQLRAFLLGETQFPRNMGLILAVNPREKALISIRLPYRTPVRECHGFTFHIPGLLFVLNVGKKLPADMPLICFATNPAHPILVADLSKDIATVGSSIFSKAHKSKKLIEYMSRKAPPK